MANNQINNYYTSDPQIYSTNTGPTPVTNDQASGIQNGSTVPSSSNQSTSFNNTQDLPLNITLAVLNGNTVASTYTFTSLSAVFAQQDYNLFSFFGNISFSGTTSGTTGYGISNINIKFYNLLNSVLFEDNRVVMIKGTEQKNININYSYLGGNQSVNPAKVVITFVDTNNITANTLNFYSSKIYVQGFLNPTPS